ncbi:MAG TPA: aminoacyl-tRNA hydrolase [Euzebya sp.]|nr:aminoacyl-tRNA hydrolase [Euzebya sp.]
MDDRWLAVGLTNPQAEYGGSRHNIGADVIRALAQRQHVDLRPHKAQALVADTRVGDPVVGGTPLTLAIPFGYMNNSGGPVQQLVRFYKVPTERLIIVQDELDLEPGVIRLKRGGSGGHNGVKDVKNRLGSDDFLRVRFGIGRPPGQMPGARYVLQRFAPAERPDIDVAVQQAADAILLLITDGLDVAQNRIHATG